MLKLLTAKFYVRGALCSLCPCRGSPETTEGAGQLDRYGCWKVLIGDRERVDTPWTLRK